MVDCLTDNRNRTVADVRHAFSKHGGNLGADGSVNYQYQALIIFWPWEPLRREGPWPP
ncbi:MAG TPA: YebC/PmpR family DNA-binding transcriptional regulator [Desulfobacterales bacterium]|nr:YebC/PmpR family DNA-binding transcriptional regulator [Desulfobacterales bacterium]